MTRGDKGFAAMIAVVAAVHIFLAGMVFEREVDPRGNKPAVTPGHVMRVCDLLEDNHPALDLCFDLAHRALQ